jgi:predicted DNA-binding protein (MmcQ/YjbR family)
MNDLKTLREALLAKPEAEETYPFDQETMVIKVVGKMFALVGTTSRPLTLSLKCDPAHGEMLRDEFPAIKHGYHLDKRHWITLTLDGSLEPGLVQSLIDESYRLVVKGLPKAARERLLA